MKVEEGLRLALEARRIEEEEEHTRIEAEEEARLIEEEKLKYEEEEENLRLIGTPCRRSKAGSRGT